MNAEIILQASQATLRGTLSFPEIVQALLDTGVEYYHVDYVQRRKIFYGANGDTISTFIDYENLPAVGEQFDHAAVKAAILDSQLNGQKYREFTQRAMIAGVQGYFAFLKGQRVVYWGRQGDQHIEWFPGAKPE